MSSAHPAAAGCPNCGSPDDWGSASWCPNCGFYPGIGRLVETPAPLQEELEYDHWWQVVPEWLWAFGAGFILIFISSVGVRLYFAESPIRGVWTLGQLLVGGLVFLVAHILAFMHGCSRDARLGPLDFIVKPWETWKPALQSLPNTDRLVCSGGWSLSAAVLAVCLIGGIDYEGLFASNPTPEQEKSNPIKWIMSAASAMAQHQPEAHAEDMSMEEALNEFAGGATSGLNQIDPDQVVADMQAEAGMVEDDGTAEGETSEEMSEDGVADESSTDEPNDAQGESASVAGTPGSTEDPASQATTAGGSSFQSDPRPKIECVVFGYTTNEEGELRSLLLAALTSPTRLEFVSKLSVEDVPPEILDDVTTRLNALSTRRRLVNCPYNAKWVRPEIYCTVAYEGWTIQGLLRKAEVLPPDAASDHATPRYSRQSAEVDEAAASILQHGLN